MEAEHPKQEELRDELMAIAKTLDGIGYDFLEDCRYEIKSEIEEDESHTGHWADHPRLVAYRKQLDEVADFLGKWGPDSDAAALYGRLRRNRGPNV